MISKAISALKILRAIKFLRFAIAATISVSFTNIAPAHADVPLNGVVHIYLDLEEGPSGLMAQRYTALINRIRDEVSTNYSHNTGITFPRNDHHHGLLRITLRRGNTSIDFWMRPDNMYILGYTAWDSYTRQNRTRGFSDSNLFNALNRTGQSWATQHYRWLPYTGSYTDLERIYPGIPIVNRTFQSLAYGNLRTQFDVLRRSVQDTPSHGAGAENYRGAILYFIGMLAEGARLYDVYGQFATAMSRVQTSPNHLGALQVDLENNWGYISRYGRQVTNGTFPQPITTSGGLHFYSFAAVAARLAVIQGY
ncbi:MAG: hypothetical protein H2055_10030 [Sphingopyxis sp.]|nr:hypothetical protein [Sphingopyxis sp.]